MLIDLREFYQLYRDVRRDELAASEEMTMGSAAGAPTTDWELICEDEHQLRRVERLAVPGGHIYKVRLYTLDEGDAVKVVCHASTVFVPTIDA